MNDMTTTPRGDAEGLEPIAPSGPTRAPDDRAAQFEREADGTRFPGLTPGLRITSVEGPRAVEDLTPGDFVLTRENGFQPVLWVGQRQVAGDQLSPALRPVRVERGALGPGVPTRPMVVAPRLRVTTHPDDATAPMVPVGWLVGDTGIDALNSDAVIYVVLGFEAPQVILAEGAWVDAPGLGERLGAGNATLLSVFPELAFDETVLMDA
ncbi:Hint domain-containing protein [Maritimibacter sp. DP1N21-5]|uniref:Hint domain-containing protein n=1 Tax=Maritimibacter sp. DP1N21-5 TaxID=2836867 RepID=UPI001C455D5B|nr:Hint domain-containing protein [Maritimibacter sp. DP1N21-5]MBV7408157.1 Hint domain-containing protein [Maritimibacter sp. DP1N21-5]